MIKYRTICISVQLYALALPSYCEAEKSLDLSTLNYFVHFFFRAYFTSDQYTRCLFTFVELVDVPGIHFVPDHISQNENNGPHVVLFAPTNFDFSFFQLEAVETNVVSLKIARVKKVRKPML